MVLCRSAGYPSLTGLVVLSIALLVAVACAAPPQTKKEKPPSKMMAHSTTAEQPEKPVKVKSVASVRAEKPPPTPQPEPAPNKIARRAINSDPTQLMGLAPDAINRLLGPPSLLRTEPPAQVWQYKIADCVLDIFLYTDTAEPESTSVTYFEIRGDETASVNMRTCFTTILESRMIQPATTP